MKRTQREISQTLRSPTPGELNRRVQFRVRQDIPAPGGGLTAEYTDSFKAWARVRQVAGSAYLHSVQIDETITHTVTIRYRRDVNTDMEAVFGGQVYRVMRVGDLNDEHRFTFIEVKELGSEDPQDPPLTSTFYGGYDGH